MTSLLVTWLISSFALWCAGKILPGVELRSFWDGVLVAAIFNIFDWLLGWFLFVVIGLATLGLGFIFSFLTQLVCAAIVLKLTTAFTDRIRIQGFGWAFAAAAVISAVTAVARHLLAHPPHF
jgi:putative membrane protein